MLIPEVVLAQLRRHSEETYPSECCGFLLGPRDNELVDEVRRCVNRQDELHSKDPEVFPRTSRTAYSLAPQDVLFLDRSQRSERPVRIIYHSHNDAGAYFSAEDKAFALMAGEPAYPVDYLVLDVRKGNALEARLFRFTSSAGDFVEISRFAPLPS